MFGPMMADFDDDMFMRNPINMMNMQMRNMNRMMNSLMPDPFSMLTPFDNSFQHGALMERQRQPQPMGGLFGFQMPNMNRLLNPEIGVPGGASFCSSSVISMSSGPDGRPQIYQATSSSKTGPGGVRETRKTVEDSLTGVKKMAIGHHIGDRAHIIEKEQDLRSGQLEERQEFINLEEEQAEDFDREFTTKATGGRRRPREILSIQDVDDDDEEDRRPHRRQLPAIEPARPSHHQSKSIHPHPYKIGVTPRRQLHRGLKHSAARQQQDVEVQQLAEEISEDEEPQVTVVLPDDDEDENNADQPTDLSHH